MFYTIIIDILSLYTGEHYKKKRHQKEINDTVDEKSY